MFTQASWLAPPELLTLKDNEIHVWRASLEMTPHQARTLGQFLSSDEMDRAERFHFQKDRDRFIAAHGLLRSLLGTYLLKSPDELRFSYGPSGKPALEEKTHGKTLRFNASHSDGLALFAFAGGREIGVDLERLRSDLSFGNIADQFFSQREAAALNTLPEDLRRQAFFALWTRKEALMKADGTGLALGLNQYEVLADQNEVHIVHDRGSGHQDAHIWSLRDLDAGPGYASAVAVEGRDWQLRCWQWKDSSRGFHNI